MRPWVIVLASAFGALLVIAAIAVPELIAAPAQMAPVLLSRSPALVVAGLASYGLCAILMTTATLVTGILRLRHHLAQAAADQVSDRTEWAAAFVSGLRRLAPRLAATLAQSETADGGVAFEFRLAASDTRGEIARLYYVSLARSHFLSALIVLAGIAALGVAHDHASLPIQPGVIPTASAMMVIAGLILLGILGRIAVDVTAEPLLEAISQLPTELAEVGLLRRAVELLELNRNHPLVNETIPAPPAQIPEGLVASIEQGHHTLLDAVSRLSASAGALESTMRTSVETLEAALHIAAAQHRPDEDGRLIDAAGFPELRAAVEELTAVLQRLSAVPEGAEAAARAGDRMPRSQTASAPRLARELRQLLQEIETAR